MNVPFTIICVFHLIIFARRGHPPGRPAVARRKQQLSALEGELGRLKDQAASATTPDADQKAAARSQAKAQVAATSIAVRIERSFVLIDGSRWS